MTTIYFKDGTVRQFPLISGCNVDWVKPATLDLHHGDDNTLCGCFLLDNLIGWYTEPDVKPDTDE